MNFPLNLPGWLLEVIQNSNAEPLQIEDFKEFFKHKTKLRIALEGMPGGGKTSLLNSFKQSDRNILCLDQFITPVDSTTFCQAQYYRNDIYKSEYSLSHSSKLVLLDRDFISTLAFTYAYSKLHSSYEYDVLNEYYASLIGTRLKLCDIYIHCKVPLELTLSRKNRTPSRKNIWCNKLFLQNMLDYYDSFFNFLKQVVFVLEINTESSSLIENFNSIESLISKLCREN